MFFLKSIRKKERKRSGCNNRGPRKIEKEAMVEIKILARDRKRWKFAQMNYGSFTSKMKGRKSRKKEGKKLDARNRVMRKIEGKTMGEIKIQARDRKVWKH